MSSHKETTGSAAAAAGHGTEAGAASQKPRKSYRKDKPWDRDDIDHWKIEVRDVLDQRVV